MNALTQTIATDRMLGLAFGLLAVAALVLAADAHLLCDLFCIHGQAMTGLEICSGRA